MSRSSRLPDGPGQPIVGGQCLPVARVEPGDDGTVASIGTAIVMTVYPEQTDDAGSG